MAVTPPVVRAASQQPPARVPTVSSELSTSSSMPPTATSTAPAVLPAPVVSLPRPTPPALEVSPPAPTPTPTQPAPATTAGSASNISRSVSSTPATEVTAAPSTNGAAQATDTNDMLSTSVDSAGVSRVPSSEVRNKAKPERLRLARTLSSPSGSSIVNQAAAAAAATPRTGDGSGSTASGTDKYEIMTASYPFEDTYCSEERQQEPLQNLVTIPPDEVEIIHFKKPHRTNYEQRPVRH